MANAKYFSMSAISAGFWHCPQEKRPHVCAHSTHPQGDTVFLQTAISVKLGTYVFHWKIENVGGIQYNKQKVHFPLERSEKDDQKLMQLWKGLEILRKDPKVKRPILCNENSKDEDKLIWQDLQVSTKNLSTHLSQQTRRKNKDSLKNGADKWCQNQIQLKAAKQGSYSP